MPPHTPFNSTTADYELRCRSCSKLLGKHALETATIEIKCNRCGTINSILDGNDTLIFITAPSGEIIYANEQLETITGFTLAEVLGKTPAVWGGQMPAPFYAKLWDDIAVQKKAVVARMTNKRKDGSAYECTNRISPILNESGDIHYFLGIQTIIK